MWIFFLQLDFFCSALAKRGISVQELEEGFSATTEEAKADIKAIFDGVDIDGSGEIDFSEWIVAAIDKKSLTTDEKLKLAFSLFDKDGSDSVSLEEVRNVLTNKDEPLSKEEEAIWKSIIDEIDVDGNGAIDFAEFALMIRKIVDQ